MSSSSLISRMQTQSSAKSLISHLISVEMSFVYRKNNKGPRTVPWGAHPTKPEPNQILLHLQTARCCLKHRNESFHFNVLLHVPVCFKVFMKGVSKAFSNSSINLSTCPRLSKILAQSFITVVNCDQNDMTYSFNVLKYPLDGNFE